MSEFKQALSELIQTEVGNIPITFSGKVVEVYPNIARCDVEIAGSAGVGVTRLRYRTIPANAPGMDTPSVVKDSIVVLSVPNGEYNYAEIVSIRPPNYEYQPNSVPRASSISAEIASTATSIFKVTVPTALETAANTIAPGAVAGLKFGKDVLSNIRIRPLR